MNRLIAWSACCGLGLLLSLGCASGWPTAKDGNDIKDAKDDNIPLKASSQELQWFRDAKFGLFVHWGPVSQTGKELSWARLGPRPYDNKGAGKIPFKEYDQLYKTFNPVKYNPDEWIATAKAAGMKYIVFTTKHHDGFSEFHTKQSDYSIANTPYKEDLVKKLADACHKADFKLGFYYSQRDWHHPDYLTARQDRYLKFMFGQIEELLTNYGKVDIMWFDSIGKDLESWKSEELIRTIRRLQPGILINNRVASVLGQYKATPEELQGDFGTPEGAIGEFQAGRSWESCICLVGNQWSYKPGGKMMSLEECIDTLVRCVGGNGNLLLDVGPMADGRIEPRQVERLKEIGAWLAQHGDTIYGTRGGPFLPGEWGASTHKGATVWVHVLDWSKAPFPLALPDYKVVASRCLTGGEAKVEQTEKGITLAVPEAQRDKLDTIVELTLDKPLADDYVPVGMKKRE